MRAVSNTSPISNLASIGRLDLLKPQFSEIWIPAAVARELENHPGPAALDAINAALSEGWIVATAANQSPFLSLLLLHLHPGEAEAIALAIHLQVDMVLIDEQEGRQYAAQAGLSVSGVLGVLLRAKRNGTIQALRPEIESLRNKARFFISPSLEVRVLAAAGE
jgi:predicted nucleic acid-binding protein